MMWESQTNTWEWTGHHKTYEVPLCNMCGTVRKRKASSLICSHIRSHRFYLAWIHRALFPSPLPTACLWWPGWEFHTPSLIVFNMDILHRGRSEGQEQLPSVQHWDTIYSQWSPWSSKGGLQARHIQGSSFLLGVTVSSAAQKENKLTRTLPAV